MAESFAVGRQCTVFEEPKLVFASGETLEHPRDGLTLFGPFDSSGIVQSPRISYGIVGTRLGISRFQAFSTSMNRPIFTDSSVDEVLWPHFPGFEEAFHSTFSNTPSWIEELDERRITEAVTNADSHQRVFGVVSLYLEAIRAAKKSDEPFRLFIVVVPDVIFTNCRSQSRISGGHGHRIPRREQRMRSQMADFFESYEPEQYEFSIDFRRQIKARVMDLEVPIQIVRESTLRFEAAQQFGERHLTPASDRAWNIATAMYYKGAANRGNLTASGMEFVM